MNKFGLELEYSNEDVSFESFKNALRNAIQDHDPNRILSSHENARFWTIKSEHCGLEITSPAMYLTAGNLQIIKNVFDSLRLSFQGRHVVNRQCGFHVHLDLTDVNSNQICSIAKLFRKIEPIIFALNPSSRRNNSYVRSLLSINQTFFNFNADKDISEERYGSEIYGHSSAFNLYRFSERGTCEIRYAASTIRGSKIVAWVKFLSLLKEVGAKFESDISACPEEVTLEHITKFVNEVSSLTVPSTYLESKKAQICNWVTNRYNELLARNTPSTSQPQEQEEEEETLEDIF